MPAAAAATCKESWGAASPCCLTSLPADFWLVANMCTWYCQSQEISSSPTQAIIPAQGCGLSLIEWSAVK